MTDASLSGSSPLSASAQAALRAGLPRIAAHAVEAIFDEVPSYAHARTEVEGVIEGAVETALGAFLTIAARTTDPSTPLAPARAGAYDLGRGEARAGRSMDALLAAYRVGARVSWREMSTVSVEAGMTAGELARFAELVFAYIDELSAASVTGHTDELAAAGRERDRHLERLGHELLTGAPAGDLIVRAERASWVPPSTLSVVLVGDAHVRAARAQVERTSLVVAEPPGLTGSESVVALLVPDLRAGARGRLATALSGLGAVLGPTRPWSEVALSYRRALRGWRISGRSGREIYDTDEHLTELVLGADLEALADLRAQALAPLADLPAATREKLVETLRLWVLHRGRREPIAAALFVHPQTIRYRVAQLRDAFGDRLDDPQEVLRLVIALGPP